MTKLLGNTCCRLLLASCCAKLRCAFRPIFCRVILPSAQKARLHLVCQFTVRALLFDHLVGSLSGLGSRVSPMGLPLFRRSSVKCLYTWAWDAAVHPSIRPSIRNVIFLVLYTSMFTKRSHYQTLEDHLVDNPRAKILWRTKSYQNGKSGMSISPSASWCPIGGGRCGVPRGPGTQLGPTSLISKQFSFTQRSSEFHFARSSTVMTIGTFQSQME